MDETNGTNEAAANGGRDRRGTFMAVALLAAPGVGFLLPFLGPWLSMTAVAILVPRVGLRVWRAGWRHTKVVWLAIAGLWLPAVLPIPFFFLVSLLGSPEAIGTAGASGWLNALADVVETVGITFWLLMPLAGPEDFVSPGLAALFVLALGSAISALARRPSPWLVGAVAAPLTYAVAIEVLGIQFIA